MNLETIQTATLAAIKNFARENGILPVGDLRKKQVWLEAVTEFLSGTAIAVADITKEQVARATTPEAVEAYKASAIVAARFAWKAFVTACIVSVAIGIGARQLWEQFKAWVESEGMELHPKDVAVHVAHKGRSMGARFAARIYCGVIRWVQVRSVMAMDAIDGRVVQPAQSMRRKLGGVRVTW